MRILLTGFGPFGGETLNPSWEAVKRLEREIAGAEIIPLELPVSFVKAPEVLIKAVAETDPDVILSVGQAGGISSVHVERVAINVADTTAPDNDGDAPTDRTLVENGPDAHLSNLPLKAMIRKVQENKIPCAISNTAGTYVCNCVLYNAMELCAGKKRQAGFIHLPFLPEQVADKPGNWPSMELSTIEQALRLLLTVIAEQ